MTRRWCAIVWILLGAAVLTPSGILAADGDETEISTLVLRALEAGIAGNNERRMLLLEQALKASPDHGLAHWQLGHVLHEGKWLPAEEAAVATARDERYVQHR